LLRELSIASASSHDYGLPKEDHRRPFGVTIPWTLAVTNLDTDKTGEFLDPPDVTIL
jgi:hypothetical protein